ncbi:MAG: hypothetical protein ACRELF_03195, partial [Gemmataceae bacterium]
MQESEASHDLAATKEAIGPEGPSPLAAYSLRTSDVIAVALLAAAFILLSRWPLWYTDVWGHLKFGQWIVQHRALPERDPFTPIANGQPCIHFYWLGQSSLYLLFSAGERLVGGDELHRLAGGVDLLATFFGLLNVLRCLLLLLAYRRASGSMPLACVGLVVALIVVSRVQRPQVFGEVLFSALLLALSRP